MKDQTVRPLQLAKSRKESIEVSFDDAISSLERVNHFIIDLIKKGKIQKKTLLKKSNKLIEDSIDLLIAIDLNPEEKHQKEKKGFKKRIKSFLRRFDPRPDFTFKEGE